MNAKALLWLRALVAVGIGALGAASANGQPIAALGAAGDSLTNEYDEISSPYALSWTQILIGYRNINMGPRAAEAGLPSGWGDIRGPGYEFNFARPGATTDALILEGQHTMLANAVRTRGVSHAVICASGNDVAPWNAFTYSQVYYESWSPARLAAFASASVENIRQAVRAVKGAGAKVVVGNMPDFSVMPAVQVNFPDVFKRMLVRNLVIQINAGLSQMAQQENVPLADLFGVTESIFGTPINPNTELVIKGYRFRPQECGGASDPPRGFVADRIHFGTIAHAYWANEIISALNVSFLTGIAPLGESEILACAGVRLDTTAGVRPSARPFRFDGCAADTNADGALDTTDIFEFLSMWFAGNVHADTNASGALEVSDILAYLVQWFAGCL